MLKHGMVTGAILVLVLAAFGCGQRNDDDVSVDESGSEVQTCTQCIHGPVTFGEPSTGILTVTIEDISWADGPGIPVATRRYLVLGRERAGFRFNDVQLEPGHHYNVRAELDANRDGDAFDAGDFISTGLARPIVGAATRDIVLEKIQ